MKLRADKSGVASHNSSANREAIDIQCGTFFRVDKLPILLTCIFDKGLLRSPRVNLRHRKALPFRHRGNTDPAP